ncbi:quinol:cytochrome C oxidoreductase [Prolixibacteraceae bacterium JC049]|nr:quinol:cytochrome C oxidoreductase [Prolixibacteraceae bacterium JC049]
MNLDQKFIFPAKLKMASWALIAIGVISFVIGFMSDAKTTWANYLLNNFYFVSLSVGALFFLCIQYITNAGWSAAFKRVPQAMGTYLPFAFLFFLLLYFGLHSIYHWTHEGIAETDKIIAWKAPYLNIPFFMARVVVFFVIWILLSRWMRKLSIKEDMQGGLAFFKKSGWVARVFIFAIALTFPFFVVDMIMSIDTHWFSTLFALKNFVAAFLHGSSIIILIVLLLSKTGYFPFLNKSHLHDFSRYLFMLCIVWGYFWFAQFMLIWYGNLPEETVYYVARWKEEWQPLFFIDLILNWFVPFIVLMPRVTSRSFSTIIGVIIVLIVGQYVDLHLQIMPGAVHHNHFSLINVGMFLGFVGLFTLVVLTALSKYNLYPKNHPYIEESTEHHF